MPLCYEQNFKVFYFECDPWDRMRPGAVLRRIQEISTDQCESLGINEELYRRTHTGFLLSRMSLEVNRMPQVNEPVRMETRAYGMRRAVYHRRTSLYAETGEMLCEADTRWVLVDTETRRIMRKPLEEFLPYFNEDPGDDGHGMDMPKPASLVPFDEQRATYGLCDRNGHVNNTGYADIMCDHLPTASLQRGAPRKMLFYYHNEIPIDSVFSVQGATVGQEGYYFLIGDSTHKNFEGFVLF